jgi:NitT/TauT family transport system substrate-binding protein
MMALFIALLLVIFAGSPAPAGAGEPAKVRVIFPSQSRAPATVSPYTIAKRMGYFAEEGLDVDYVPSDGSVQAAQITGAGTAEYGIATAEGVVAAAGRGTDMGVTFVYMVYHEPIFGLAVKKDSPVRSPRDLKGKTIGVASMGSAGITAAKAMLHEEGVDPEKDANYVAVGIGAVAGKALEDGRVDALALWDEQYAILQTIGLNFRELPFTENYRKLSGAGVLVRRDYLAKNRVQVLRFCRAIARATIFGLTNPEAAVKVNWEVFPESKPKGVEEAKALRDAIFVFKRRAAKWDPNLGGDKRWGGMTAEEWKAYLTFLNLEGKVDLSKIYTTDLLDEVNRFDKGKVQEQARAYR